MEKSCSEERLVFHLNESDIENIQKAYSVLAEIYEDIDNLDYELDLPDGKFLCTRLNNDEKLSSDDFQTLIYTLGKFIDINIISCHTEEGYNL